MRVTIFDGTWNGVCTYSGLRVDGRGDDERSSDNSHLERPITDRGSMMFDNSLGNGGSVITQNDMPLCPPLVMRTMMRKRRRQSIHFGSKGFGRDTCALQRDGGRASWLVYRGSKEGEGGSVQADVSLCIKQATNAKVAAKGQAGPCTIS